MQKKVYREILTPQLAKVWLSKSAPNRRLKEKAVAKIARDIENGNWVETPSPICFDAAGEMFDGQHRCEAVLRAGIAVPVMVAEGYEMNESLFILDGGTRRSYSDMATILGERNTSTLQGVLRVVWNYKAGWGTVAGREPSNFELHHLFEGNPKRFRSAVNMGMNAREVSVPSVAGAIYFLASEFDAEEAEVFMDGLITGAGLDCGSPILALRNAIAKIRNNSRAALSKDWLMAAHIKAWNAFIQGIEMYRIMYGPQAKFPVMSGPDKERRHEQ